MASYLCDNCIPRQVASALTLVEVQAHHVTDTCELGPAATDLQIAEWCQQNRAVWVTADLSASKRRRVQEIPLLAGISIAFCRPPSPSGWTRREWLLNVLKRVDEMESGYDAEYPVWYRLAARTFKRLPIPQL